MFSSLLPSQAMAATCSSYNISATRVNRPMIRAVMAIKSTQQPNKIQTCSYKPSALSVKVFEDEAKGIICYRDENGEMVCEGYDEGHRYSPKPSSMIYNRYVCREIQDSSYRQERQLQILEQQN